MRLVILHYHIFKNAGMSIVEMLAHSFGGYFSSLDGPKYTDVISNEQLMGVIRKDPMIRALSSHQIHYPMPEERGFLFYDICFLRDPIDRIRSMYEYFRERRFPGEVVSEIAHHTTLGGFISRLMDEMPWYVSNPQVNMLANGVVNDEPTGCDLAAATQRMLQMSFLGVVDCFDQSLWAGQLGLRNVFPELTYLPEAVNVSRGLSGSLADRTEEVRAACQPNVYDELLGRSALDLELVALAREEVERRYKLVRSQSTAEFT